MVKFIFCFLCKAASSFQRIVNFYLKFDPRCFTCLSARIMTIIRQKAVLMHMFKANVIACGIFHQLVALTFWVICLMIVCCVLRGCVLDDMFNGWFKYAFVDELFR